MPRVTETIRNEANGFDFKFDTLPDFNTHGNAVWPYVWSGNVMTSLIYASKTPSAEQALAISEYSDACYRTADFALHQSQSARSAQAPRGSGVTCTTRKGIVYYVIVWSPRGFQNEVSIRAHLDLRDALETAQNIRNNPSSYICNKAVTQSYLRTHFSESRERTSSYRLSTLVL